MRKSVNRFPHYVCEGSTPDDPCGPVVRFDDDGNPCCQACWDSFVPMILHHSSRVAAQPDGGTRG